MQLLKDSLEFMKTTEEFKIADLQRHLKCGYGYAWCVIDTFLLLGAIENVEDTPAKYKSKQKG